MGIASYINGTIRPTTSTTARLSSVIQAPPTDHVSSEIGIPAQVPIRSNLRSLFSLGWVLQFKETPRISGRIPRNLLEARRYNRQIVRLKKQIKQGNLVISDNIDYLDSAINYVPILFGVINTIINLTTATVSQTQPAFAPTIYVWTNFSTRLTTEVIVLFLIRAIAFARDSSIDIKFGADLSDQMLEDLILQGPRFRGQNFIDRILFQGDPITYPMYVGLFASWRDFLNFGWKIETEDRPAPHEKKKLLRLKRKIRNNVENIASNINILDRSIIFTPLLIQFLVLSILLTSQAINNSTQLCPGNLTTSVIWSNFAVLLVTQVPVIILMQCLLFFRGNQIKLKVVGDAAYQILDKLFKYPNDELPPHPSNDSDDSLGDAFNALLAAAEAANDEEAQLNEPEEEDFELGDYSDEDSEEEDEEEEALNQDDEEEEEEEGEEEEEETVEVRLEQHRPGKR